MSFVPEVDWTAPPEPQLEDALQLRSLDPVRERDESIEVQEAKRRQVRPVDALVQHLFLDRFDPGSQRKPLVELNP